MDYLRNVVTLLAFACVFIFSTYEIHKVEGERSLFTEDIIEVNKTYQDDVYDCVNFYKQPAFNHPLLANHTFHHKMTPSSTPKLGISNTNLSLYVEVQLKGKDCPIGTVPIRRITTEDRIRERLYSEKYGFEYNVQTVETPGTHYAVAKTKWSPIQKYNGASAEISIWNPSVQSSQYSSGQIVIRNGHDNMQVGWTVNPILYGDSRTHLFIYTSAGKTHCFNLHCPGFVIVNKDMPIDGYLDGSTRGGRTYIMRYMIHKDVKDGNWWLRLGPNYAPVGFWPKNIFTNLADMATSVEWGGQVFSPPNVPSPPMGSGYSLARNSSLDAYCGFVSTINEAHQVVDALNIDAYSDTTSYQIRREGNVGEDYGNLVIFGGPGGVTGN